MGGGQEILAPLGIFFRLEWQRDIEQMRTR